MRDLKGRVAVITGGASGVGRAMSALFAQEGMRVIMADIDQGALDEAAAELSQHGDVVGMAVDLTKPESVDALADKIFAEYGNVHVLMNNAGVGLGEARRRMWDLPDQDWQWGFAVNVFGVVNGIRSFVPRMLEKGEDGYVVNSSSGNGGLTSLPTTPIYASSKASVTSLTEVLNYQFQMENAKLKAGVLYPGPNVVNTNILNSGKNRPDQFTPEAGNQPAAYKTFAELAEAAGTKMALTEPAEVAQFALDCIKEDLFWMIPEGGASIQNLEERTKAIKARERQILPS